jgi:aspartyl-tRNA(Asn)/glutamyl-tRNA(Gln) amidotransferase subunit A
MDNENKNILKKTIREIVKEKIPFNVLKEVCVKQYEKYKDTNMYITPLMDKLPNLPFGIPISIKDNFLTKDILTTCGSKMLSNFIGAYDATVVSRLKAINCVNFGKCNMDEFAMGSSGVSSFFGATSNIWSNNNGEVFSPGGSSSGSGVSVASGAVFASIATDTSGSIRLPASWCGIVGFKPTYGLFSRYGVIPLAESLDHPGLITRKVDDCRYIFENLIGKDENDLTSVNYKEKRSNKKKFAILKEAYETNEHIQKYMDATEKTLIDLGYEKKIYSIKEIEAAISVYIILCRAECSSNLQRYDGIKFGYSGSGENLEEQYIKTRSEGFGLEVQRRIMIGGFVTSSENINTYVNKAQELREDLKEKILHILSEVDFILTPTAMGAFTLNECKNINLQDPIKMQKCDLFTVISNLCGLPSISVPIGYDENGSPVGVDIMGGPFMDLQIMDMGEIIENSNNLHNSLIDKICK